MAEKTEVRAGGRDLGVTGRLRRGTGKVIKPMTMCCHLQKELRVRTGFRVEP